MPRVYGNEIRSACFAPARDVLWHAWSMKMDTSDRPERVSRWGLVQGWLAAHAQRRLQLGAAPNGLQMRVEDPEAGSAEGLVRASEEPSVTAWRLIAELDGRRD